jgi:type IV secretion system protein VirB4
VDEERRAAFEESGNHFERLSPDAGLPAAGGIPRPRGGLLYENRPTDGGLARAADAFVAETDRVFDLLDGVMPEIAWLDDARR